MLENEHETPESDASDNGLLHVLYDGVMSNSGFQQFVEQLRLAFGLKAVIMIMRNVITQEIRGFWITGISQEWMDRYSLEFADQDLLAHAIHNSPIARFYASNLDLPHPELHEFTAFHRGWIAPQGVSCAAGATLLQEGPWLTQMFLQRSVQQAPFSREDILRFDVLMPHLQRAIQMRQRFAELQLGQAFLASSLDMLAIPILLIDDYGRVAHANREALQLMADGPGIWLSDGHLQTADKKTNLTLHIELTKAIRTSRGEAVSLNSVVTVQRPCNEPLVMLISPLIRPAGAPPHGAALLFMFDPARAPAMTEDLLMCLFGLSRAEVELAAALCRGKTLDDVSAQRGTSIHTIKTQLKSIFLKTGTRRQSELVSLLLTSPAYFLAASPAGLGGQAPSSRLQSWQSQLAGGGDSHAPGGSP